MVKFVQSQKSVHKAELKKFPVLFEPLRFALTVGFRVFS